MKIRLRLILVGTAFAVTIFGVTQLGWASSRSPQSGTVRKTTLTPGGDLAFDTFKDVEPVTGSSASPTAATFPSWGSVRLVCWPEEQSGPSPSVSDASLVVTAVSSIAS